MNKLAVFEKHLNLIKTSSIRSFTEFCILRLPEYFWTIDASTSGNTHGGETLVDHVKDCLYMAEHVIEQFKKHWTDRQKDQLISSIILHDGWRCGEIGKERVYDVETVIKRNMSMEKVGTFRTHPEHAEVGFRQLLLLANEYNSVNKTNQIIAKDLSVILKSVRYHYGPFLDIKDRPFSLSWPYDSVVMQVHNIDFHAAHNATLWSKKGKNNGK